MERVTGKESGLKADLRDANAKAEAFTQASELDGEKHEPTSSQAKLFASQVNDLRSGDLNSLFTTISDHTKAFSERAKLYENYCSESAVAMQESGDDTFRLNLLRHLSATIVVKEHRMRYQKE
jgi:hypothetical protein